MVAGDEQGGVDAAPLPSTTALEMRGSAERL